MACAIEQDLVDPNPFYSDRVEQPTESIELPVVVDVAEILLQRDRHFIAKSCQTHSHTSTCYKYWNPKSGEPRECRFGLGDDKTIPETTIDREDGTICLRCLDSLVNNFNTTILEAVRCNMDIKFMGSGEDAKAVIHYITDYITKTQLSTHVAYAAFAVAAKRLGDFHPDDDERTSHAKNYCKSVPMQC